MKKSKIKTLPQVYPSLKEALSGGSYALECGDCGKLFALVDYLDESHAITFVHQCPLSKEKNE